MSSTEEQPTLPVKTFTTQRMVAIGTSDVSYSIQVTGPDISEVSQYEKMFNGIMEQALSLIQHAYAADHTKGDCLAEAFTPDQSHLKQKAATSEEDFLAALKDLPSV